MRLGLIGPCHKNHALLRERSKFVLDTLAVDRAVYLGVDGALDEVVGKWAAELVGGEPSDDAVWERAAQACAQADHEAIDAFLSTERRRARLKVLECLPHPASRTIELFEGVVAVIIHDKALLDAEDILPASILVFGKSAEPMIHRVGPRTFLSPGPADHPKGGVALLTDEKEGVILSIFGPTKACLTRQAVASPGKVRMTVQ